MKRILLVVLISCLSVSASAGTFRRVPASKRIPNRYIVMFKSDVNAGEVEERARGLARQFEGRLIATMRHAMRGFAVAMTEQRARALARHPLIEQVEEDEVFQVFGARFDMRQAMRAPVETQSYGSCPFYGSYYLCTFWNDDFWALDRIDNLGTISSSKSYSYATTGAGVRAYLIDSGVYADHQEFAGRVDAGANMLLSLNLQDAGTGNWVENEEPPIDLDGYPATAPCGGWQDPNGDKGRWFAIYTHGTAVASVLGGETTGVAKNVTIVPVKVIPCNSDRLPKLAVATGLDWIQLDMQGRPGTRAVVNMSIAITLDDRLYNPGPTNEQHLCESTDDFLDTAPYTNCVSAVEHEITQVIAAGIPVVASANNQDDGNCRTSPARLGYGNESVYPTPYRTITVGATMAMAQTGYQDARWTCAGAGTCGGAWPDAGSNYGPCVSIWAPGWNVRAAGGEGPSSYRAYGANSGTSFATPIVAGVVARILERYPWKTPAQIWADLTMLADMRSVTPDFDPSGVVNSRLVYIPGTW